MQHDIRSPGNVYGFFCISTFAIEPSSNWTIISRSRRDVDGSMLSSFDIIYLTVTFVPIILLISRDNRSGYISGLKIFLKNGS